MFSHCSLIWWHVAIHLWHHIRLKSLTAKDVNYREIDVVEVAHVIGHHNCQWLNWLHNVSGGDCGGNVLVSSRRHRMLPTWNYIKTTMQPSASDSLMNGPLHQTSLQVNCSRRSEVWSSLYATCTLQQELRCCQHWDVTCFDLRTWKEVCCILLVLPHIRRANYIAMPWQVIHYCLPSSSCYWTKRLDEQCYVPVKYVILPAPRAVIELTSCGC